MPWTGNRTIPLGWGGQDYGKALGAMDRVSYHTSGLGRAGLAELEEASVCTESLAPQLFHQLPEGGLPQVRTIQAVALRPHLDLKATVQTTIGQVHLQQPRGERG